MQTESPSSKLKREARTRISGVLMPVIIASVLWFAISVIIQLLTNELSGLSKITTEINAAITSGSPMYSYDLIDALRRFGSIPGSLLSLALSVCSAVIGTGFTWFTLRVARGDKPDYKSLFDGFTRFGRVLWLCILKSVIVSVCAFFFVVPGIVMWFRYSMAIRICYDNPDFSAVKCLKESARLMRGLKVEYLTLGFSFAGWFMLGIAAAFLIGVSVTDIWLNVYAGVTASLFYDAAVAADSSSR
ncbi:MAG: DUF975 family protein [Oscillospiraceae bacterium]|jgi:uncharacterized membrane protein|nr:DUF975 family protein [Oscillospiraceae bacterium]